MSVRPFPGVNSQFNSNSDFSSEFSSGSGLTEGEWTDNWCE